MQTVDVGCRNLSSGMFIDTNLVHDSLCPAERRALRRNVICVSWTSDDRVHTVVGYSGAAAVRIVGKKLSRADVRQPSSLNDPQALNIHCAAR